MNQVKDQEEVKASTALPAHKTQKGSLKSALLLFFLAPLFGEYLLGNLKISEIVYVPFLAPLYGAGALLIREITRHAGRGSATMLILGVAYGLIEEGLVDQMLFNQSYFAGQDQISDTYIPVLGLDVWLTIIVLAMHAVWSTYIPISLVESLFPEWGTRPWLSKKGIGFIAVIFMLGSTYLGYTVYKEENFFASAQQLIGTVTVIVVLVLVALKGLGPVEARREGLIPHPWIAGCFSFVVSSLFMLTELLPGWIKVGACLLLIGVFLIVVSLWSHRLALAAGGILTYAWLGVVMEPESGPKATIDYIGSVILAFSAIIMLAIASGKLRKSEISQRT